MHILPAEQQTTISQHQASSHIPHSDSAPSQAPNISHCNISTNMSHSPATVTNPTDSHSRQESTPHSDSPPTSDSTGQTTPLSLNF